MPAEVSNEAEFDSAIRLWAGQSGVVTDSAVFGSKVRWEVSWPSGSVAFYSAYELRVLEEISEVHIYPPPMPG